MNCKRCKDSGVLFGNQGSGFCGCKVGEALQKAHDNDEKMKVPRLGEKAAGDLDYFSQLADRLTMKTHGMTFSELQEKKTKELLQAMKAGRVTTAQVYHERDRKKLVERFGLYDSEDFVQVLVPPDIFRRYYPKHEGNGKVKAYRLNPQRYGPPGPEIEPQNLDLFQSTDKTKTRKP